MLTAVASFDGVVSGKRLHPDDADDNSATCGDGSSASSHSRSQAVWWAYRFSRQNSRGGAQLNRANKERTPAFRDDHEMLCRRASWSDAAPRTAWVTKTSIWMPVRLGLEEPSVGRPSAWYQSCFALKRC